MSIALTTNKVAAAAVGVAMVFSFAFVTPAQAQSVEDLTAQINSLLATISSLQAQLAGMTGGSTTTGGSSACYNFTLSHSQGDQGGDVMNIQKYLNASGFTVSASGAGSAGNESSYFGAKTKAAVVAFQNANAAQILAPVGLSAGTGYWGASSRSFANANCGGTGTGTGTGTTVPTGTGLTVSSVAQPANGLAVQKAARVPFTKFSVTNNSGSAQTINNVTVQRGGLMDDTVFSGIVLLDQNGIQLGNARVLNSNHQANIGETVTLNPGETRTFTVAGNMATSLSTKAGQVGALSVVAINTSASVAGSLPITGAAHTINGTLSIGTVTAARGVEDPNAAQTKEIGTTDYTFSAIKLTAGSEEDVRLHSVRFDQSGSAGPTDVVNVKAYVDGVEYTPTISGDTYTVSFGSGIVIAEGLSKEVVLKGSIAGGTNRNIAFDVYKLTDINATGETYGYGITPTADGSGFTSSTPTFNASVVTISAGTFNSVSKSNAAPAANIAKQKANEILGAFNIDLKGEAITVQTLNFDVTVDAGATARSLTNVTLVDQNGAVVAGPVDSTTTWGTSATTVADALTFSNISFPTGVTTLYVKGQLDSDWVANDTLAISTNPNSDWSDATGDTTGDTITLPSSTATANTMTVKAASLTATTLTQPAARSIVAGAADFVFATASLDAANSGEDVRVTTIVLEDTASSTAGAVDIDNVEIWANLSGGSTNDSTRGDRFETRVADAEQFTGTTNGDNTLSITLDTHITIAKNTSVDIAVVADLSSGATALDEHTISLDTDSGDVTATGVISGTSVDVTPTGAGQTMTVSAGGTLTTSVDSSSPTATLVLDNTSTEQTVAVFRLAASNVEDLDVDSIKITNEPATAGDVDAVAKYVFYNGSTKLGEVTGGSAAAELFLNDGSLVIPADDYELVTVKVVMNNIDGTQVENADTVQVTINAAGDVQTTGRDSGSAVDSTGTNYDAAEHTMYETVPAFAFDNSGVSTVLGASANYLAGKIVISNTGDKDITFDSTGEITLQVEVSGTLSTSSSIVKLEKSDGTTLDTVDLSATTGSAEAVITFATNTLTIPAGGSETVSVRINTGGLTTDGNTLQVWLSDDTDDNIEFAIDGGATDYSEAAEIFRGDIYGPTHVNP